MNLLLIAQVAIVGDSVSAPSIISRLFDLINPGSVATVAGLALAALGGFQFFTARRKKILGLATYYGFHVIEDVVDNLDEGAAKENFKKIDEALKAIDAWMLANGWRPLKPGEVAAAKLELSALHGVEVAKAKVLIAAAAAPSP